MGTDHPVCLSMDFGVEKGSDSSEVEVLLACRASVRSVAGSNRSLSFLIVHTNDDDDDAGEFLPAGRESNERSSYAVRRPLVTHPHTTQAHKRPHDFLGRLYCWEFFFSESSRVLEEPTEVQIKVSMSC